MTPRPLVYVGPSASAEQILRILPQAVIRPAVRRGDLYRDRMLRFSVFIILDGVFAQEDAISPREVVDVLEDGAAVLGAASMGALRAVDCAPAGAEGAGLVYRMFQRGAVSSEDEVAVIFQPERPFPSASLSLIHIRVALRRAVRAGLITRCKASVLVEAAQALHFSRRSWRAITAQAGLDPLHPDLRKRLDAWDPKQTDGLALCRRVARRLQEKPDWADRPRQGRTFFGLTLGERQRVADPLLGQDEGAMSAGFVLWLMASGRFGTGPTGSLTCLEYLNALVLDSTDQRIILISDCIHHGTVSTDKDMLEQLADQYRVVNERLERNDSFKCEWFRYLELLRQSGNDPVPTGSRHMAEMEIATAHGLSNWADVLDQAGPSKRIIAAAADLLARGKAERLRRFCIEETA